VALSYELVDPLNASLVSMKSVSCLERSLVSDGLTNNCQDPRGCRRLRSNKTCPLEFGGLRPGLGSCLLGPLERRINQISYTSSSSFADGVDFGDFGFGAAFGCLHWTMRSNLAKVLMKARRVLRTPRNTRKSEFVTFGFPAIGPAHQYR
jgi:hypothetical protein